MGEDVVSRVPVWLDWVVGGEKTPIFGVPSPLRVPIFGGYVESVRLIFGLNGPLGRFLEWAGPWPIGACTRTSQPARSHVAAPDWPVRLYRATISTSGPRGTVRLASAQMR